MAFNSGSKMYSVAGLIEKDNIQWGQGEKIPSIGYYPKVAINDKKVVVGVHKPKWGNTILYRVGTLDDSEKEKKIDWSEKDENPLENKGYNPAVALSNDGTIVVAYEQGNETFHNIGTVNGETKDSEISWRVFGNKIFNRSAIEPSISINENGLVVAAAQAYNENRRIVFRVGNLEKTVIVWKEVDQQMSNHMNGCSPVVAINKNHIISVYMSYAFRRLFMNYGIVNDTNKIEWSEQGEPLEYGSGMYPAVTLNDKGQAVRMCEANFSYSMYYETGNLS